MRVWPTGYGHRTRPREVISSSRFEWSSAIGGNQQSRFVHQCMALMRGTAPPSRPLRRPAAKASGVTDVQFLRRFLTFPSAPMFRELRRLGASVVLGGVLMSPPLTLGQFDQTKAPTKTAVSNQSQADTGGVASSGTTVTPNSEGSGATSTARPVRPEEQPAHLGGKYDVRRIGDRGIGKGVNLYSLERERALGSQLAKEVESEARLITDPVVTEYVNRIGQTMVRNSDARVPFTIKVIDDDEVNAFALPGGYFFVNTGLILAAENEAELAGVMAHEIAHVAARHATKNATRAEIFNVASIPLIFMGGPAGFAIRQIAGIAVPMSFLKFSRDAEREADLLGLEYEYAAGYDPAEFVHFFETIKAREKEKRNVLAKAFSTHPMTSDRIRRAQKEIETMLPPRAQYIVNTSEFDLIKARLRASENSLRINSSAGNARPTLRRRGPDVDAKGDGDGPPVLRRRPN